MKPSSGAHGSSARRFILLVFAALVAACASDEPTEPIDEEAVFGESLRSSGDLRTYELRVPDSYNEGQPTPLLLAFHGNPDTGAGFEARSGLTNAASDAGFITVYPDGIDGTWWPQDFQLTEDLIEQMAGNLTIDRDRIYITGFSAGGSAIQAIVCELSEQFAAAVSVGALLERSTYANCLLPRPIPTLFVHGTEDTAFPWEGLTSGSRRRFSAVETMDRWTELNGCSGDPVVDTLPDLVDDSTWVWSERWTDCAGNSEVMLYAIEGGGHTWPSGPGSFPPGRISREISSVDVVEFLGRHVLPPDTP
jgi:polyhydroxybutyrate depolymerase